MEFLTDDVAALTEPTDDELSAYLQAHADTFRVQRRFTFSQVYLNPEKHGENLAREVEIWRTCSSTLTNWADRKPAAITPWRGARRVARRWSAGTVEMIPSPAPALIPFEVGGADSLYFVLGRVF